MDNFSVGLTNTAPNVISPLTTSYKVCDQWPGVALDGETLSLTCLPGLPGVRYVLIMIINALSMSICEMEVYGKGLKVYCSFFN
jgi:hypothetical protein